MLPFDRPNGKAAYHRLKVYVGVPEEFAASKKEKVENAMRLNTSKYITVGDISVFLGSKVR
jgi:large subunit ribosomal protein L13